jgi:hypothetical protein
VVRVFLKPHHNCIYFPRRDVMKNYLADMLTDVVDEEGFTHALKIDAYIRGLWAEKASDDFKKLLEVFEAKPSDHATAEFVAFILITEAMLADGISTTSNKGGV